MAIVYEPTTRTFSLHTAHTTYQMQHTPIGFLLQVYYGRRVHGILSDRIGRRDRGFSGNPNDAGADQTVSADVLPLVYPCDGCGDYRAPAIAVLEGGCDLRYQSHTIQNGKYELSGLPAVYADSQGVQTLSVVMRDERLALEVTLLFGVLEDCDVITRAVIIRNCGKRPFTLTKAASASLDWLGGAFDLLHFPGRYANERHQERTPLFPGSLSFGSRRGTSSHAHNPFAILAQRDTTEDAGGCYGICLLYSGGFCLEAQTNSLSQIRLQIGIQDELLHLPLAPGERFVTPEVALSYTHEGLSVLSHHFHHLIRHHVCRGVWKTRRRPILINNWEATYFSFDGDKIYDIARSAHALGIEMMVLDDGWFGSRNSDKSGLGDWTVNEEKMRGSLKKTVERVQALGMKFGLWIEPEAVSEDSDLYRAHPDWAFSVAGRKPVRSRNQLVLDFSKPEVVDGVFAQICAVLDQAEIDYLKMDMNRSICDVYHEAEPTLGRDAILYRYTLGVYDFLERLHTRYPKLLIEGCCGGGGRFDAGMLFYCPQIWCSDNTDAMDRLRIQHGTSFCYPICTIGSHVSAVPNHQTGRSTPLSTRGVVAMSGSFGYELDPDKLTEAEKEEVRFQIREYKADAPILHNGLYFRLTDARDPEVSACLFVLPDQSKAILHLVTHAAHANAPERYVFFKALQPDARYEIRETGRVHYGSDLMYGGWRIPMAWGDHQALVLHLKRI